MRQRLPGRHPGRAAARPGRSFRLRRSSQARHLYPHIDAHRPQRRVRSRDRTQQRCRRLSAQAVCVPRVAGARARAPAASQERGQASERHGRQALYRRAAPSIRVRRPRLAPHADRIPALALPDGKRGDRAHQRLDFGPPVGRRTRGEFEHPRSLRQDAATQALGCLRGSIHPHGARRRIHDRQGMIDKRGVMTNIGAPRVRLTLAYAALLALLLAAFSIIVYVLLSMVVFQDIEPFRDDAGIVAAAHRMLDVYLVRLLIANGIGLVFVVAVAAFLAKITLRPLERAIALQRQFTNDASHDLRTPLAVIRTETSAALHEQPTSLAGYTQTMQIIDQQAQRMERLIDQLLTLSHLDADSALDREPTDLTVVVNGVVRELQPLANARSIEVKMERAESAVVMGDELKLSQLVGNLLDNAIKYSPKETKVNVSVWQARDSAFVAISDQGTGIAAQDVESIFLRHKKTNGAATNGQSIHGLGLPLCRWIARAHGGDVVVESQQGQGSTFTVQLPAMKA